VNAQKSAVARPWGRKFLGFSFTAHRETRLRIAPESVRRLAQRIRELLRRGRGRSLAHTIETLNLLLRGWIGYFQIMQAHSVLDELDGWVRRRLRCLLWRQWKRPRTRERKLLGLGLDAERAWRSAGNGRGPWWNAGASHMNLTLPAAHSCAWGWSRCCASSSDPSVFVEPPYAEPHVRWCGRAVSVSSLPTR
jgi:RNA-directed DNA polymerase